MKSDSNEVMYVNNPIEAGLPGHWVPLSVIKRVLEMRASAVNHWTTPHRLKLKHLTMPITLFKTSKSKYKTTIKHKLITTIKDTNSPNDELTGKSIKIEPDVLNNIEKKTKELDHTTVKEATTVNENKVQKSTEVNTKTNNIYNENTDSSTTNLSATSPSTKGTSIEITKDIVLPTTTTSILQVVSTLSTSIPLTESSTITSAHTAPTTPTSEPTTSTIATLTDTSELITTTATIPDTSEPITSTTTIITTTSEPITSTTTIITKASKPITTTATILDSSEPITSTTTIITTTSEPITTTATISDTSEPMTSTTSIITKTSEPITTTTPFIPSTQSIVTTEESSERSDTGNPFY